jgi:hypothetical protein
MRVRVIFISSALACACSQSGLPERIPGGDAGSPDPADSGLGFITPPTPDAGPPGHDGGGDAGPPDPLDAGVLPLRHSPILDENQRPGGSGWRLGNPSTQLAAFADRTSALPGEQVSIRAGAAVAADVTWELWRLGYYGGAGGRRLASGGPVKVAVWANSVFDPTTGSVSAPWPVAFAVTVPAGATTGAYLVKVTSALGETYSTFVVREPMLGAPILYPVSTNTYQAYNAWGGTSLYRNQRSDWKPWHAYAVSFDRPYQNNGAGELFAMDRGFITFAEAQGYDIAYVTDTDLDRDPGLIERRRMLLLQGHTEYWTAAMRLAVEKGIAQGANVAFLASNSAYWQVRFADSSRRLLIAYKEFASLDPATSTDPAHVTTRWRDPPLNRPENAMIGGMFGSWLWTAAPLRVVDPSMWLWTGAGVEPGTIIAGVYGSEVDKRFDNGVQPSGVEVVANGLVESHNARLAPGETTIYPTPAGGLVFNAGSITFSRALSNVGRWDARIQQFVANLFSRFAGDGTLPAPVRQMSLPQGLPVPTYRPGVKVSTVTTSLTLPAAVTVAANGDAIVADGDRIVRVASTGSVSVVAGSDPGCEDGPVAQSRFRGPRGVAVGSDGTIYVADTLNHRIRAISGGTVRTIAGSDQGFADGVNAMFSQPMGIALTAKGTILVADSWNHRLREVTPQGMASTWVGTGEDGIVDGPSSRARIVFPIGVTMLPSGDAVIVEPSAGVLRKVAASATHDVTTLVGYPGDEGWNDGTIDAATVFETLAAAARSDGQLILIDAATARIRALRNGAIDTLAGGQQGGTVDGSGATAGFGAPRALAVAPDGTVLVVDAREHALRRITLPP